MILREKDITFKAVRAGGPGGQNVNRRATKVQARVEINNLPLDEAGKNRVRRKLKNRINDKDELIVEAEEERSQRRNKETALLRMNKLIESALKVQRRRIPTKPSRAAKEKRLQEKKIIGRRKKERSKNWKRELE